MPRCVLERVWIFLVLLRAVRGERSRYLGTDSGKVLNMRNETKELENEF